MIIVIIIAFKNTEYILYASGLNFIWFNAHNNCLRQILLVIFIKEGTEAE